MGQLLLLWGERTIDTIKGISQIDASVNRIPWRARSNRGIKS
jgi:hypothetical protein